LVSLWVEGLIVLFRMWWIAGFGCCCSVLGLRLVEVSVRRWELELVLEWELVEVSA
jgi:hypothetical protein